ncbi:hypothetical protein [Psychrobacillus sp.]|uniref:hypothetical protein n=1 Tax=Psychrobacillus sp. TaxID=1871623 RepID=UPI0028BDBE3E|nr:hypothetical protein [Psychrobacillus sp.]
MIVAKGLHTGDVYATGENKAECFRKLEEAYPTKIERKVEHGLAKTLNIYPEPLKIARIGG